jgi:antitoxin component of MazEF toxin-antitoxin module
MLMIVDSPQGDITVITKANTKSNSLRTTIPMSITRQFNLQVGDKLVWKMEVENNSLIIKIKPIE